jgi:hypothetical protein
MSLKTLVAQVRWNCQVASAGQAGLHSLCGTLLRLRQLYKWEHGLDPWQEPEPGLVLAWVEEQERTWESLEGFPLQKPAWDGDVFDPFAVADLNGRLGSAGLAYGAGLCRGLAPTFFLGELKEARQEKGLTILVLGQELARDLDGTPALCQGDLIYGRQQTLAYYLWDRLSDPVMQQNHFLKVALSACGLELRELLRRPGACQKEFQTLVAAELNAVLAHEVGEALEPSLKETLPAVLSRYPQSRLELFVRALKDCLAEVNDWGRVSFTIREEQLGSLALMLALRPGLYPLLLPELEPAFRELCATGDWSALDAARRRALARLRQTAAPLEDLLLEIREEQGFPDPLPEIQRRYLAPLGL